MRHRALKGLVEAFDEAASPGAAKNIYETHAMHRRREKKAEALLVSLCTKLAFRVAVPKVPSLKPRVAPGASRTVGRVGPSGMVGGPRLPPAAKNLSTTATGAVVNYNRSIPKAITAGTTMGSI
jgi:hypothetical protein